MRHVGFTLVELAIVILIVGILASASIPAFYRMRARAREAGVRSNAHTVQLAAEDFAAQNGGVYATDDTTVLPSGETLTDLVSSEIANPFERLDLTPVVWTGAADADGRVGYDGSLDPGVRYRITGQGENGIVILTLLNGS